MRNFKASLLVVSALGAAFAGSAAHAQADAGGLSDIVITATRSAQSMQRVPVAVTALSSDTLENLQVDSAKDLTQIAPNVVITVASAGSGSINPYIRGGGVTDGGNITSEAEVGVYVDDVYQPRMSASFIEALDVDRIEVLRGPQGTLYGRNSSAGALKIITRAPGEELSVKAELGYGSWNEISGKGSVSGAISKDGKWRAGFSGAIRDRSGGRQYNIAQDKDVGAESFQGFQGDLAYVAEGLNVRLKGFYSNYESDGLHPVAMDTLYAGSDYQAVQPDSGSYLDVQSPVDSFSNATSYGSSLHITADVTDTIEFASISAYSHLDDDWRMDFSGGVRGELLGLAAPYVSLFDRTSSTYQDSFSQELQLRGKLFDELVSFVAGVYYFRESGEQSINSSVFLSPTSHRFNITTNSYAAFGEIGLHPLPGLTVKLGGRYTEDHKSIDADIGGLVDMGEGMFDFVRSPVVRKDKFRDFLPKASIDYQVTSNLLTYASYSEGFKSGGYNGLADTVADLNTPFAPQKVKAYEIGFKADFLDRRARLNVSGFINDYASIQQQYVDLGGAFITENYAATHKGIEVETSFRPIPELTLWANGVYNDGKYEESGEGSNSNRFVGNWMTKVFKYQGTAGADLSLPVGNGEFVLGANYTHRTDYFSTPDNSFWGHVPASDTLDAYVGYKQGNWNVRLSGKNLTDDRSYVTGFGFGFDTYQVRQRIITDPRSWRVSVGYKF